MSRTPTQILDDCCAELNVKGQAHISHLLQQVKVCFTAERDGLIEKCAKIAEGTAPVARGNFFEARRSQCAKIAAAIRALATPPVTDADAGGDQ